MSLLGKQIVLVGKTQKGKNRIREHGSVWTVLAETDRILFRPNDKGPWLFVSPEGKNMEDKASRWIRQLDDADFEVKQAG